MHVTGCHDVKGMLIEFGLFSIEEFMKAFDAINGLLSFLLPIPDFDIVGPLNPTL